MDNKKLANAVSGEGVRPAYIDRALERVNARNVKAFPNHFPPVLRQRLLVWQENNGEPYAMAMFSRAARRNLARSKGLLSEWRNKHNLVAIAPSGQFYVPYPLRTVVQRDGGV